MVIPSSTQRFAWLCAAIWSSLVSAAQANNPPQDLADRFELPPGFHIYRAAGPEISGGSYALTFDGEGNAVRNAITLKQLIGT